MRPLAATPEIAQLIRDDAPVAIGVSGGKDSCAAAMAVNEYLNARGHRGPRLLIHSDLGRVEWKDSLPTCQRLAERLGMELVVVRRAAGDMMDRWNTRWTNNVARYAELSCVKLILPWSTASMRFCTSELKTDVICRELVRRFKRQTIISVSGIRRAESTARSKSPITKPSAKLSSKAHGTRGLDWHPLADWSDREVFDFLEFMRFPLHEAYRAYGSSRVSCAFCIMGSRGDLRASAGCEDNYAIYREMVALEARSSFAFQDKHWLGDVAPHLLDESLRRDLERAKRAAAIREQSEGLIPPHLLYTKGWPTVMPTVVEADLLALVRRTVAMAVNIEIGFTDAPSVMARYEELMRLKEEKAA
jgi:3'-phosphoadenosine 5'-phosphosulfate sulfotransferase (PAPS reductase)/FAD synthetase